MATAKNERMKRICRKAKDDNLSFVKVIREEMYDDTEDNSRRILDLYLNASPEEMWAMDSLLNELCGWCLESIIEVARDNSVKNKAGERPKLDIGSLNIWKKGA